MTENDKSESLLVTFFSNPIVGIIGSLASIIGVFLAIYFYIEGKAFPDLTYAVHPAKALVTRAGQSSKLITSYDGKIINTDITVAQIALWNRGKLPIKKNNILKPVVLYTTGNTPILEASIRKVSRDVTNLSLETDQLQEGRLTISWDILEKDDGGVIQLIYAGNSDVAIQADGVIEGQREIKHTTFLERVSPPSDQYSPVVSAYRRLGYSLFGVGIFSTLLFSIGLALRKRVGLPFSFPWFEVLITLFCFGAAIYFLLIAGDPTPPFGF